MCSEIKTFHFKAYRQQGSPEELFKVWASSVVVLLKAFPEKKQKKLGNVDLLRFGDISLNSNLEEEDNSYF